MDPHTYCKQALDELLAGGADLPTDPDRLQRGSILAYLARRHLSEDEFVRELTRLRMEATRSRRPSLEAAARAVLRDWQARRALGV